MKRWATRGLALAGVLLALGVSGIMCQRVSERGRYVGAFSSYGSGPEGTRGVFLLAEELGASPRRWAEDLGRLPEGAMLVALGSCQQLMRREIGRIERGNLREWVERGGTLVVAGVPDYLSRDAFGVELQAAAGECRPTEGLVAILDRADQRRNQRKRETTEEDTEIEDLPGLFRDDPARAYEELIDDEALPEARLAVGTGAPLEDVSFVGMRHPLTISVDEARTQSTLLRLDGPEGQPVGVRVDVGEGVVIVLSSSSMFQNRDLATENGGVLFARLVSEHAPEGPVLFDEYHLGVGQRRSLMRYLRQAGAAPLVLQLLLIMGLLIWRLGAAFGAHERDAPVQPGGTASYVEGVGTLYAKAKDPAGAMAIMVRRAMERIAAHHHVLERDPDRLAEHLEARHRKGAADAVRAIVESASQPLGRGGLPRFTTRLDRLTSEALA